MAERTAIDYLLAAMQAIPLILATGADVGAFIKKTVGLFNAWGDSNPSDGDWADLNDTIAKARRKLHSDTE